MNMPVIWTDSFYFVSVNNEIYRYINILSDQINLSVKYLGPYLIVLRHISDYGYITAPL